MNHFSCSSNIHSLCFFSLLLLVLCKLNIFLFDLKRDEVESNGSLQTQHICIIYSEFATIGIPQYHTVPEGSSRGQDFTSDDRKHFLFLDFILLNLCFLKSDLESVHPEGQ